MQDFIYNCFLNLCGYMNKDDFENENIFYFYLTNLVDIKFNEKIIPKIGFSSKLKNREKPLEIKLKCNIYLLAYKKIKTINDELEFHNFCK